MLREAGGFVSDAEGRFNLDRLKEVVVGALVQALEIKLSQAAKPSLGGLLPAPKVSAEIAAARGVPEGRDCVSPSRHAANAVKTESLFGLDGGSARYGVGTPRTRLEGARG